MNYRPIAYSVVIAVLFWTCNLDAEKDPIIVPEIDKEFNIDLWEALYPTGRELHLQVSTIKNEDCLNAAIAFEHNRIGANIFVSLNEIVTPNDCDPGMAPAKADINFGSLSAATYNLSLGLKNTIINDGRLQVSYDKYAITMQTEEGLQFLHHELRRVPSSAIWGYVAYAQSADVSAANAIVDAIGNVAYDADYPPGYYGYFTIINNTNNLIIKGAPAQGFSKPFLFDYTGNPQQLKDLATDLRQMYPNTTLKLWTADGEEL